MNNNDHIIEDDVLYVDGRRGKKVRLEQYQDMIARIFPSEIQEVDGKRSLSRTVTFQVTDACNLACTYCYQINKGVRRLKFEDAKKLIDMLLDEDEKINDYIDTSISPAIIIEFIGGEPFMEIELMDQITDYFKIEAAKRRHPWAVRHCISICSNGVLYFDPKVQEYLNKNRNNISFSITIDGNKELHDSCRVFHDGSPSYDIAVAGAKDWIARGGYMGSKITIAPENITHLYDAIIHMTELGYDEINANVVYEKGWEVEHAKIFYEQLKKIADVWIEEKFDQTKFLALFEENFFRPKHEEDNQNWCFRAGTMILTPDGESPIETLEVGDCVIGSDYMKHIITKVMRKVSNDTASITIDGVKTYTTKDHPYLIYNKNTTELNWVEVRNINIDTDMAVLMTESSMVEEDPGTYIINRGFKYVTIDNIEDEEPYEVFNITVDEIHNYVANGAIVHNCGGDGHMLSIDPDGRLYPCIRYMESSLGDQAEAYNIGDVNNGIGKDEITAERLNCLRCITRQSQSTEECFNCPIAEGCSWCSAYNYQEFGTPDSRATYICIMHKARGLANVYFWNKVYKARKENKIFKLWMPDEWALEIIDEDELDMLKEISKPIDKDTIISNNKNEYYNN